MAIQSVFHKALLGLMALLFLMSADLYGQVGEVNENIEKSKKSSASTQTVDGSTSSSSGGGFIIFLGEIFANTIGAAQRAALENKHIYPEREGFNLGVDLGSGFVNNTWNISTGARVNWGIIASDFKYNSLTDITGQLNTIDWQVFILRIPIESLNLEYGLGFIAVPNQTVYYGSSSVGFDFKIRSIGTSFGSHYYWTQKTSLETRFRKAFDVTGDIEVMQKGHFHSSLLLKYSYQNYFEETDFNLLSGGVLMKIY